MYTLYVKYYGKFHYFKYVFYVFFSVYMLAILPVFHRRSTYDFPILFLYKFKSRFLKT